ncbi:3-deoxy-D-manno-octulosonic acid transferase [Thermodesulfovibrio hydrogeniphilus]
MQAAFLIYTIIYLISILILLPKEYLKRPKELRKRWLKEKFGFLDVSKTNRKRIWIHAVSVGEVIAVSKLVNELCKEFDVILSTVTDTGQRVAEQRFKDLPVKIIYLPFDIPFAIKRALKIFEPSAFVLTETELWPNLIKISSKKIPVFLVNGRLSEKSFKGYRKVKFFMKKILSMFTALCVQEEIYKERFKNLGAEESKIFVTGNTKFDIELREIQFEWENSIPKPVILAGSTHHPEEEIIVKSFLEIPYNATLLIAPRHPERFDEVYSWIKENSSCMVIRLSSMEKIENQALTKLIILIDKMGILGSLYRICDIAIVGGSFIPHGGQNPLEPAYWRKPIVCGPYMHNFPFIDEFVKAGACFMIEKGKLVDTLKNLIENKELKERTGERAYKIFLSESGATKRTVEILEKLIR